MGVGDRHRVEGGLTLGRDWAEDAIPEQVVCRGKRREAGTGKEGVGRGDRRETGRETLKAEPERDGTPRGGFQPRPGRWDTYSGPSSGRWGSPPAAEEIGSRAQTAGPGRSRTGRWSRPWLQGPPPRGARGP